MSAVKFNSGFYTHLVINRLIIDKNLRGFLFESIFFSPFKIIDPTVPKGIVSLRLEFMINNWYRKRERERGRKAHETKLLFIYIWKLLRQSVAPQSIGGSWWRRKQRKTRISAYISLTWFCSELAKTHFLNYAYGVTYWHS